MMIARGATALNPRRVHPTFVKGGDPLEPPHCAVNTREHAR
jgi:hypothetical protein